MTDGKPQPCRNGCGQQIYVSDREGKWLPYDVNTDNKHDCPNYKKKSFNNFKQTAQKVEQEITQSSFKKTDALGRIAELEVQTHADIKDLRDRLLRLEEAQRGIVAQVNFMTGNEVKERQPKKYEEPTDEEVMED